MNNKLYVLLTLFLALLGIQACSSETPATQQVAKSVAAAEQVAKNEVLPQTEGASAAVQSSGVEVPAVQMAIVQTGNGGAEVLKLQEIPVLAPGPDEVLIKVVAAAINPIEWRIREGGGAPGGGMGGAGGMGGPPGGMGGAGGMGGPPDGMGAAGGGMGPAAPAGNSVPGGDVAGIVVKAGDNVTNLKVGDSVFAKLPFGQTSLNGAYSQYAIASSNQAVLKPDDQTFAEASGIATVGMTAMRTLDHAEVQPGQRVFINGIGGGIGSSAAQIAMARGATVLGTASARHHEFLKSLGVSRVVNYREEQFDEVITDPVDVVIETVGTDTANQAVNILKPSGHLVSIAGPASAELCDEKGVTCSRIGGNVGRTNADLMAELYELAQAGKFRLNVDMTFPLEQAGAAQDQNHNVGTSGKIVVIVDPDLANTK